MRKNIAIALVVFVAITLVAPVRSYAQTLFPDYRGWILDEEIDWSKDTIIRWYVDKGTIAKSTWENKVMESVSKVEPNPPAWISWTSKKEDMLRVFRWDAESKTYKLYGSSR